MRLRPHHLLCTQSYSGKGYNNAFVENMNQIVAELRENEATPVEIVFSTDDLCAYCPNMLETNLCKEQDKVKDYDQKVIDYFHIEEKIYLYQDITRKIRAEMTPEMLKDICGNCEWYPTSACKRICKAHSHAEHSRL